MIIETSRILKHIDKPVTGVVHVGAHEAQELSFYRESFGDVMILWIEADPQIMPRLREVVAKDRNSLAINATLSSEPGQPIQFHRANMDQSSSILELGTHKQAHPEVSYVSSFQVYTKTLDSLMESFDEPFAECSFLNMDVQGAEGLVIQGGTEYLKNVDYIYTEVNRDELYIGCIKLPEMDVELESHGFVRVETEVYEGFGWGDALYVRKD